MPAKLTVGNISAHNRYMASMGSPAIASKNLTRRVSSAMKRKTDPTHKTHIYPKRRTWSGVRLRDEPAVFNLATQKLKHTQKRRSKVPTKAIEEKKEKEENKESEAAPRVAQDEEQCQKGKSLPCRLLGGKKKKGKRKTKRRRKTRRRKTRHRTKRRVKKHRKRKTRRR